MIRYKDAKVIRETHFSKILRLVRFDRRVQL